MTDLEVEGTLCATLRNNFTAVCISKNSHACRSKLFLPHIVSTKCHHLEKPHRHRDFFASSSFQSQFNCCHFRIEPSMSTSMAEDDGDPACGGLPANNNNDEMLDDEMLDENSTAHEQRGEDDPHE